MSDWRLELFVTKHEWSACESCGLHATLRSLDHQWIWEWKAKLIPDSVVVHRGLKLCGVCWTDVRRMLREAATPDSSGAISPP